jgi:hypothetical protein
VITKDRLAALLGAPVRDAAGVALLLHVGAEKNVSASGKAPARVGSGCVRRSGP